MSTTSLKLPDEIKLKVANTTAKEMGISPHAFMVEAIKQAATNAEYRKTFIDEAKAARQASFETSLVYPSQGVFEHLRSRAAGKQSSTIKAKAW